MLKIILLLTLIISFLQADILDFYLATVQTLAYDKQYKLYKHSARLSQKSILQNKYFNLSLDSSFSTANDFTVSLNDNIDIFNKESYLIDDIFLDIRKHKLLLYTKQEKLFKTIVSMVSLYNKTKQFIIYERKFYAEQNFIYKKLLILKKHKAISNLILFRFKDKLTSLQIKIIKKKNQLLAMKKILNIYAPNQAIPTLNGKIKYSKKQFISKNPKLKIAIIQADKYLIQRDALNASFLPKLSASISYNKLEDPTSYNNNYQFNVTLHIPLAYGNIKKSEAFKIDALSKRSGTIELKIKREEEYLSLIQNYKSAKEQLEILKLGVVNYQLNKQVIKNSFFKNFITFDSYIQSLNQILAIQEQIIDLTHQMTKNATIINYISSGAIYG